MKIIATIGPSCMEKSVIKELIEKGVNIFRFNFSHGRFEEFETLRKIIKDIDGEVHIMGDLSGGKIRISEKLPYIYKVYNGEKIIICGEDKYKTPMYKGKDKIIPLNLSSVVIKNKDIKNISMKDNTMQFKIIEYKDDEIRALVTRGGIIRGGKGCNILGIEREKGIIRERDKECIKWCVENKIDIICQSFVESVEDISIVKEYIEKIDENYKPFIWSKIETPLGIEKGKEIIEVSDGIVIGRGDLVPESNIVNAPIYQDRLLKDLEKLSGEKEIIVGTHILNSMKNGKRADFSEVDSIYNLIHKKVTGFLLSGETSIGKAPVKTVKFLKGLINAYTNK
ncbi:MAG: pyruvate kinase [Clostridium sp.]|uniref:pyruvate kinase n=1 Tax=Clostridium sp. TaxID=1506 RepID=UPI003EE4FEAE